MAKEMSLKYLQGKEQTINTWKIKVQFFNDLTGQNA